MVDLATLKIIKKIPLTGPPNNIAIRNDGLRVYAAITGATGGVDIIDTVKMEKIKFIRVWAACTTRSSPPTASSSSRVRRAAFGDRHRHPARTAVWSILFEGEGVRVFCFEGNTDGSTKRMFMQLTNLHGFAIVDWESRKEVGRIKPPEIPGRTKQRGHPGRPCSRHSGRRTARPCGRRARSTARLRVFDA